jgi:SAM-dependent methyltransferase
LAEDWRRISGPDQEHHQSLGKYITNQVLATRYDKYFRDNALFEFDKSFIEEMLPENGRMLDLGCGTGRHLLHFARRGWDVCGVDLSEPMLHQASRKMGQQQLRADLFQADILDLSFLPADSFDAAICMFSTLGMISQPQLRQRAVQQAVRCLRPGGCYIAHVHNRLHFLRWTEGRRDLFLQFMRRLKGGNLIGDTIMQSYRGQVDLYLHNFTLGELLSLLKQAGLKVTRTVPLNEARDGPAQGIFNRIFANGFLVAAEKPLTPGESN